MAEYIEREVLLQTIQKDPWIGAQGKDYALCDIAEQPTADVASVVHGEWILDKDMYELLECIVYSCSVCGRLEGKQEPYCNCGAKMDKVVDNNG